MKNKSLVIVGDSAFAQVAYEYFTHDSDYTVVAFSVEKKYRTTDEMMGLPVVDFEEIEKKYDPASHAIYVAVVYTELNRLRTRLVAAAKEKGYSLASYISSRAFVWQNVKVGEHCFIFEDNTVQPFSEIGDNVVLWSGNHIGHHSKVGDHCFVSSHVVISGFAEIGQRSFLGVNSTISNNVVIGEDCWIGPGLLILKDTEPGKLFKGVAGEPAKVSALRFFRVQ